MGQSLKRSTRGRIIFFIIAIIFATGLVSYRLFELAFIEHGYFVQAAKNQYLNTSALLSDRGTIYMSDKGGKRDILAVNKNSRLVFVNNNKVKLAPSAIELLAETLDMDAEEIQDALDDEASYRILKRDITDKQAEEVKRLGFSGIGVTSETVRFYPHNSLASHLAGFVGFSGDSRVGQYGTEEYYDNILRGNASGGDFFGDSLFSKIKSMFTGRPSEGGQNNNEPSLSEEEQEQGRGRDILLTIDGTIQEFVEAKLQSLIKRWSSESGIIIVQEPQTGAILAMASAPAYNPNRYWEYDLSDFMNPAIQKIYEPGSTFKPITMAGAIDSKALTPSTTYEDKGFVTIGGYTLSNFDKKARGVQTMRDVLQKSLNTGTIFAERKMGNDAFLNYVVGFGFGEKTGIDLSGEISGEISNLYEGKKVDFATASFGQGIAVTPIQLINAYSAIANGGKLMRPYVVKEVINPDNSSVKTKPEIIDSPISPNTAKQMQSMLTYVVDKSRMNARITGYDIAAKTGTAQIADPKGGYLQDEVIHNFVGFAPSYSPRFVVMIKIDKPHGARYAASTLAPAFSEITRFLLNYYNIPPTR